MLAYLEGYMWAHLGAMLAHLGPMLGPSGADVGASWGYIGASWGYVGRSCAMFVIVQEHVEWHRAKKHCKLQGNLSTRTPYSEVGGRGPGVQAGARIEGLRPPPP